MKIVVWPLDQVTGARSGAPVTLGDDSAGDYVVFSGPEVRPAVVQEDNLAWGAAVSLKACGNARRSVRWQVSREHGSVSEAFEFEFDHGMAVPAYCHLGFNEGAAWRFLAGAVLTAVGEGEPRTRSTKFNYAATGGLATSAAPAGVDVTD